LISGYVRQFTEYRNHYRESGSTASPTGATPAIRLLYYLENIE